MAEDEFAVADESWEVAGTNCSSPNTNDVDTFNAINFVRGKLDFPAISCNNSLRTAAREHAEYMDTNDELVHTENAGKPQFYETSAGTRATKAGYNGQLQNPGSEVIAWGSGTMTGQRAVDIQMNSVFHRVPFVSYYTSVFGSALDGSYHGITLGRSGSGAGDTAVWPYNGATNMPRRYRCGDELPTACDSVNDSDHGAPVSITVRNTYRNISLSSYIKEASTGRSVPYKLITRDDYPGYIPHNQGYLLPTEPLKANTKYDVQIGVNVQGGAFIERFSFTTGNS